MARRKSSKGLDTKDLVVTALGVSPIPVVGEIALARSIYKTLNESGQKALPPAIALPVAGLVRFGLYTQLYIPIYKAIFE